jgi:hypothetical protein
MVGGYFALYITESNPAFDPISRGLAMTDQRSCTGRSGQMAVIGELLFRRCNAAIPEVDVGTDVFAFHDDREEVARLQVKTERGIRYRRGEGYSAKFRIPRKQLEWPDKPPLFYALLVRLEGRYVDFLIIPRAQLNDYWNGPKRFGALDKKGDVVLNVQFREKVICQDVDLSEHRNAWESLPPLQPTPVVIPEKGTGAE